MTIPKMPSQCYWYGRCECGESVCEHFDPLDIDDEYDEYSIEELIEKDYEWFCEDWEIYAHQYD